jgi:hypothetical protein
MGFFDTSAAAVIQPIQTDCVNERLLLAAVVRRAAFDIALYKDSVYASKRKLAVSAYNWMFNNTGVGITSFESICEILGQDESWIRQQTLLLRREDVKRLDRSNL